MIFFGAQITHALNGRDLLSPCPPNLAQIVVGMGCFWGVERCFWVLPGVYLTAVGYAGGTVADSCYGAVCSGVTGHAEVVRVVFDPEIIPLDALLKVFWESHDPTQGHRQGNDRGSQYRSCLFVGDGFALDWAHASRDIYQKALERAGRGRITTEIRMAPPFYLAEVSHQQYLAKNPDGYCGLRGTGVIYPGLSAAGEGWRPGDDSNVRPSP